MDRTILTRSITGFFIILIFTVSFIFKGYYFFLLFYTLLIGCVIEFSKLTKLSTQYAWLLGIIISSFFLFFGIHYLIHPIRLLSEIAIINSVSLLTLCFCIYLFDSGPKAINRLTTTFFGVFYLLPSFLSFTVLVTQSEGYDIPMALFILIWIQDSFALLIGKLFGKTQLMDSVSPNKTWEGLAGASIICLLISLFLNSFFPSLSSFDCVVLAIFVILFGTLGDLVQSKLKRHFSVKNTGIFFPGHGGFLDRMDSFLLVIPPVFAYFVFILHPV